MSDESGGGMWDSLVREVPEYPLNLTTGDSSVVVGPSGDHRFVHNPDGSDGNST